MTHSGLQLTSGIVRDALAGKAKVIAPAFNADKVLTGVSTDSRSVRSTDLFVALKGEAFDGHDFIEAAVSKGCRAVLCEKYPAAATQEGVDIFLVEDTLASFRALARQWRELLGLTVVGVAGSVGKTTTKDLLSALLRSRDPSKVLQTKGSQNGFVGLPMTMMGMTSDHEAAVIEIGIDAPGAMIQHIDLVRPDVALVTAISEEHLEWLKDLQTIAYEENLILVETAKAGGVAVINLDDPWVSPVMQSIKSSTKIGFSLGEKRGADILTGALIDGGSTLEISGLGHKPFTLPMPLPGVHNARNQLAAVAAALSLGFKPDELKRGIEGFIPSGGRSQIEKAPNGAAVLCDFYNANPASMRAAFAVAHEKRNPKGKLWLCLADMKELGTEEEALHRGLAKDIAALGANTEVLLFGERMTWLSQELRSPNVKHFASLDKLISSLKTGLKNDDFVLIKGSNSMKMSQVWDALKA